ncbi:MAG: NADH:ubiquinone reductase (Na(+)-transporting) subunit A [Gammaproteobacteria bacterium]|jgi:Na+-transporting NADH:ubiquinone oxidoreductase subunit A
MKIRVKRGFDPELAGAPSQQIHDGGKIRSVALLGSDYPGLKPAMEIGEGDQVRCGQTLFTDRHDQNVRFTAPAAGRIRAIHRGARRRLASVVIDVDDGEETPVMFDAYERDSLSELAAEHIRARLLESGLWTALRTRPFGGVASPAVSPSAILVTAIDTNPHAADPAVVIAGRAQAFADGVAVLTALAERLYVCKAPGLDLPALDDRVRIAEFLGPHPAGLPGTHIAHLTAASPQNPVWHVGYQDVIATGELFVDGRLSSERVVALGGPGALRPRLLRTCIGSSLEDLLHEETRSGARIVPGALFSRRIPQPDTAWLGRYDTQISVLDSPSMPLERAADRPRGMMPVEAFERVWPFNAPVLPLLRALLVGDCETAEALGCLDLAEEDLAVCSWVCPTGQDYGAALRHVLHEIESGSKA